MPTKLKDGHIRVKAIESAGDTWSIEFADKIIVHCAKAPLRNDSHIDTLITSHGHSGIDPIHTERMQAMIAAVRDHEAQQ